jgi:putative endonuclease
MAMKYVYILESCDGEHFYVGITDDLRARLAKHNAGEVPHTSKYKPWRLKTYIGFSDHERAIAFERYLRPGLRQEAPLSFGSLDDASARPPAPPRYYLSTAFNRSRKAMMSFFIADSSPMEHAEAARMDCGTARAFSRSA